MLNHLTIMNAKFTLVQISVLLLYVPFVQGLFIFTKSCGTEAFVNVNLPVKPLEGTWFMLLPQTSVDIKLSSKFNKICFLRPKVVFQLYQLRDSVEIVHNNTVYCKIPTHHQWLTAPQKVISVVSCSRDERTAKKEIFLINNQDDSEFDSSREGMILDNSTPSSSETLADLLEDVTISADDFHPSTEITTAEEDIQTKSTEQLLPAKEIVKISTQHTPHKSSSSPHMMGASPNEVPEKNNGEFYSTEAIESSKHQNSSDIPVMVVTSEPLVTGAVFSVWITTNISSDIPVMVVTSEPVITGAVFSEGITANIFYIVLIGFSFLIIFVIIYGCYLIYHWREREKNAGINQKLFNKKECAVTFRNAEEVAAEMKHYLIGRKKSEVIIIDEHEVPKCLR